MVSYKDKIITFPLFNTCYPQNLARNLARFLTGGINGMIKWLYLTLAQMCY